ncbi:putative glycolipid-binding domain-containing protein [Denitrobaculum tricleocarpae]|uniref:Glycolipid-binding domain-containing protein n=1 Tax=Denitrobaculum tricleocarpae TaxID=2591009 RepID=A0A545TXQ7_9PROT|nr:putative glycolipid-binding domain-containing protein [Denitrobaculum tricleocarpae]TQV81961.1 hypothetical protein FKG95_06935 [Denitrobaculum tricleocarpae]
MSTDREQPLRTVLWRRLDIEGMDACSFERSAGGYLISGTALFQDHSGPALITYQVSCNADWSSQSARVSGWTGSEKRDFTVERCAKGQWYSDGEKIAGVDALLDIDLGFTPATNTNALKRLRLEIGQQAETTAVWLDTEDWRFKPLKQVYHRLSETEYAYSSPSHDYAANLVTDAFEIIRSYPQLWTEVSHPRSS